VTIPAPLDPSTPPEDVAATFCATLVDEWARGGVRDAVVSPGSRSTPMALALAADERMRVHVLHDERAAGFVALGIGMASGAPALVLTTSGTAAVELHPAVVEAHQAAVPMIVLTADRPPELRGVGAPQTIDQVRLYGSATPWFRDADVPEAAGAARWGALARAAHLAAGGARGRPGPVHVNLPFREPLIGRPCALPVTAPTHEDAHVEGVPEPRAEDEQVALARSLVASARRGVIVAGDDTIGTELELGAALGWPVLVSGQSRLSSKPGGPGVAAFDAILRHEPTAAALQPDLVVQVGAPPASKVLGQWLQASGAPVVALDRRGRRFDVAGLVAVEVTAASWRVLAAPEESHPVDPNWLAAWVDAEAAAQAAIDATLAGHDEVTEPGVARALSTVAVPRVAPDARLQLHVSSSMPVRDHEWYRSPAGTAIVTSNRGANGIDGVVSTAVGLALGNRRPTAVLIGDVAFLHDSNALLGIAARGIDLTIVVVDNDGGGIFSFLPPAAALPTERFEQLFGTPHGVDLRVLAAAHGLMTIEPAVASEVRTAIEASIAAGGVRLVLVKTDRAANVAVHDEIHAAVTAALDELAASS
jgi:2-succinyl-5-enolpyruvyl-6-hydroxy-3-cyclohexene-1-carboxylate synthase